MLSVLLPHQLLLLLSDGSMTRDLELLTGARVEVELRHAGASPLAKGAAEYLVEEPFKDALEREVWLLAGGRRLVYAHSLIPLDRIEPNLKTALEDMSHEPLGRVLASRKIFFAKDKLEVCTVRCENASRELGLPDDTPLAARRYILFNKDRNWIIKAAVTEIFSPEIIAVAGIAN